jgi:hypothetical protein
VSVVALGPTAVGVPGWAVSVQLARREGLRMVRHPILWVGALLSLALFGLLTWQSAPVLHRDDVNVAGALLPFAAATLIIANLAASRAARNGTDELYDTAPASRALRTRSQLLALAFPVGASLIVAGMMFVYMLLDAPVGTPRFAELAVGPVSVALLGAAGVAVGKWKPHPALGPMAVVVIGALEILLIQPVIGLAGTNAEVTQRIPWFALWVPLSLTSEVPSEIVIRPGSWHLLYLVGGAVVVAEVGVARDGHRARLVPLVAAGAAGVVLGSIGQLTPAASAQRAALASLMVNAERHQVCEERLGVTYCAYPAYARWIDRWAAPIEGALARIPPESRPQGLVVRQWLGSYFEGPVDIPQSAIRKFEHHRLVTRLGVSTPTFWTGMSWGRGETEGEYEIGLALWAAMEAVELPSNRRELVLSDVEVEVVREEMLQALPAKQRVQAEKGLRRGRSYYCTTLGQARGLAALWIAAQATPETRGTVRRVASDSPYGVNLYEYEGQRFAYYGGPFMPLYPLAPPPMWDRVQFADAEFHYAASLLDRPADEVAEVLAKRWDDVLQPTTSTAHVLDDLGLAPHPTIVEQVATLPDDVKVERGTLRGGATISDSIPCF